MRAPGRFLCPLTPDTGHWCQVLDVRVNDCNEAEPIFSKFDSAR